ncbi:MAG TPA: hypothetical protein VKE50_08600, partial [Thermoanaerobaculia bacterium]|nr:hypothetical protein [Thermoanaerobaculia bacterium]
MGDDEAMPEILSKRSLAVVVLGALGLAALAAAGAATNSKLDVAGMDRGVKPGDDFYAYANGSWM